MPDFMIGHAVVRKTDDKLAFVSTKRLDNGYVADRSTSVLCCVLSPIVRLPPPLAVCKVPRALIKHIKSFVMVGAVDEEYGIKIAKRSCIDITDAMDMDFSTVIYNNRYSQPTAAMEQACYWLLKCRQRPWLQKHKRDL